MIIQIRRYMIESVKLDNLSKTFEDGKEAVKKISLSLCSGEVFGFLGPNGAGKTTTVKMLTGILKPTGGACQVMGSDPAHDPEKVHAVSGVVTEHAMMYDNMTGTDNLIFYGSLFGLSPEEAKRRAADILRSLDLSDAGGKKLSAYSTGMRQRLSLARALMHRPSVLFLDEPTSGLDPESAQNVNNMIDSLAKEHGVTVFLCTHQLRYAQEICSRFGRIDNGILLATGTLCQLRSRVLPVSSLTIRTAGGIIERPVTSDSQIPAMVREIVEKGGDIYAVEKKEPSLEEIYFALTSGNRPQKEVAL